MNENRIKELNTWHQQGKHTEIIRAIEELPQSEWDYELKNQLGRAYNNESEYEKALAVLLSASSEGTDDALWNFRVGYGYYYNNEPEKALPYFQKSAALGDSTAKDYENRCLSGDDPNEEYIPPVPTRSDKTLNNIAWSFSEKQYTDPEEFNRDITDYQKAIYDTDLHWKPNETAFDFPELQIQYEAWITQPSDLLENESLIDDDEKTFEEYPDEEYHQVEIIAKLKADNGKNFSALEFLMKTHNQQVNKELGDHVFFEGTDEEPQIIDGLPTWYIACGS